MTLLPGQLYRVMVRVPLAYVTHVRARYGAMGQKTLLRDIRNRVERMGFTQTLLATQDPTNNSLVTIIARKGFGASPGIDPVIKIVSLEHVEEPHTVPTAERSAPLDPGLTIDEAWAVRRAILHDRNPRHLEGLGSTLEPWFPVSASILKAKAHLIENRRLMDEPRARSLLDRVLKEPESGGLAGLRSAFEKGAASSGSVPLIVLRDDVKRAAMRLVERSDDTLSDFPPFVQNLARGLIHRLNYPGRIHTIELRVISPASMLAALPPREDDGFVSPSALQLIQATRKPEWSKVNDRQRVQDVMAQVESRVLRPGMPAADVLKARNQIERAMRAIDRRMWIEWYRRTKEADDHEANARGMRR